MSAKRCLNEGIYIEGSEAKHGHVGFGNIIGEENVETNEKNARERRR
jgi:hypothetical protein